MPSTCRRIIQPPDGVLIIIGDADQGQLRVRLNSREGADRVAVATDSGRLTPERALTASVTLPALLISLGQRRRRRTDRSAVEDNVDKGAFRSGLAELVDDFGVPASRPGQRPNSRSDAIVDRDEDNIAARLVKMQCCCAPTEACLPEARRQPIRPKNSAATAVHSSSFQRRSFTFLTLAQAHRAQFLQPSSQSALPQKGYQIGNRDSVNTKIGPLWLCPTAARLCMVAPG